MKQLPVAMLLILMSGVVLGYELDMFPLILTVLTKTFHLTHQWVPVVVASSSLMAALSAVICGFVADYFGRRPVIMVVIVMFTLGFLELSIAESSAELLMGRILFGSGVGGLFALMPLYLIECSVTNHRGQWVAAYFLAINAGIFIACMSSSLVNISHVWRMLLFFGLPPMLVIFVCSGLIAETPKWETIKTTSITLWDDRSLRVLVIGMIIAIFSQAVGAHGIVVYATLTMHGLSVHDSFSKLTVNIMMASALLIGSFLAVRVMDTLPRRRLLSLGMSGMTTSLVLLSWALGHQEDVSFMLFMILVSSVLFVGCQAFSLAPMASLLPGELFPQVWRGAGMGICTSAYWITHTIVIYAFPRMLIQYGASLSFAVFLLFTLAACVWFYFNIPETSQVALERLEENLGAGYRNRALGVDDVLLDLGSAPDD